MSTMKTEYPSSPEAAKPSLYQRISNNKKLQMFCRVFQCISAIVSLSLFAARLYRLYRHGQQATASQGAVAGILAAAIVHGLGTIALTLAKKSADPQWLRLLRVALDLAFVGAFIAVAVLCCPGSNRSSAPCPTFRGVRTDSYGLNCDLPYGTFVLAIVSAVLHLFTAVFSNVTMRHKNKTPSSMNMMDQAGI